MATLAEQSELEVVKTAVLPEHFAGDIGNMAIDGVVSDEQAVSRPELTLRQAVMIASVSRGDTLNQAAAKTRLTRKQAHREKEAIQRAFSAPNMASVVHLAVSSQVLKVEQSVDLAIVDGLNDFDVTTLGLYARGVSIDRIAGWVECSPKVIMSHEKDLFKKLGAWSRPHAVRRGHELGVLFALKH